MSDHAIITDILASNVQWASDVEQAEPEFFTQLANGQSPPVRHYLVYLVYSRLTPPPDSVDWLLRF